MVFDAPVFSFFAAGSSHQWRDRPLAHDGGMSNDDQPKRNLRYAIIGAGMGGILAAIKLKGAGDADFTIYEKGDGVGGTWRENRYPGLTCDVASHLYTFSFAPNPDWSGYYASGPEIRAYFERLAQDYGILGHVVFGAEVTCCHYEHGRWHLETANGIHDTADVVIAASGVLHHPRYPDIGGLDSFAGRCFHSARWPEKLDITGKRVGVIGNGSTGVQIVSTIAPEVAQLIHFQRSPQWMLPGYDAEYSHEERAGFRADPGRVERIRREALDNIDAFNFAVQHPDSEEMAGLEQAAAQYLEASVADPELREKLRPDYRPACRRMIVSSDYFRKIQQHGVLIETGAIERVEARGVRLTDATLHELDILVLATGFETHKYIRPTQVLGRDGRSLDDVWMRRPRAYYAITVPGFPNFFMINGPSAPIGNFSLIEVAERQWAYIEQLIGVLRSGDAQALSASEQATLDYESRFREAASHTIFATGCVSWYLDADGVPLIWPWSYQVFMEAMEKPRLADYEMA